MNKKHKGVMVLFLTVILIGALALSSTACSDGGSSDKTYTVTIGTLTNGSITANPTKGKEGTEITLTVTPNSGYTLKAGTLKYGTTAINETTKKFNLPASDVTVTAEFTAAITTTINEGTFTVTGIPPEHNGKRAGFLAEGEPGVIGAQSVNSSNGTFTTVVISNGSVSLPLWTTNDGGATIVRYSGNGTYMAYFGITTETNLDLDPEDGNGFDVALVFNVTFINGSATKTWSEGSTP